MKKQTCLDCLTLKEGKGTRSMGFSEIEIDFKTCNRCLDAEADRYREQAEWQHYHPR